MHFPGILKLDGILKLEGYFTNLGQAVKFKSSPFDWIGFLS